MPVYPGATSADLDKGGGIPQTTMTYLGPSVGWVKTDRPVNLVYCMDGGGAVPNIGYKGSIVSPNWLLINDVILLSDVQGSAVLDIWKIPLTTYLTSGPPTISNTITGSDLPTLNNQYVIQDSALTGWTKVINQNDVIAFNLNSVVNCKRLTVVLQCVAIIGQQ